MTEPSQSSPQRVLDTVSGRILDVLVTEFGVAPVVAWAQRVRPVVRRAVVKRPVVASVETLVQPMQDLSLGAPAIPTVPTPTLSTQITAATAKKAVATIPRCASRVYGDKVLIPGTKNTHGFKHAQCERNGSLRFAIKDTEMREVAANYELAEEEGSVYLCKICKNRWEKRTEKPDNWHGIFDYDDLPATSHFIGPGSVWYTKYAAAADAEHPRRAALPPAAAEKKIEPAPTTKTS